MLWCQFILKPIARYHNKYYGVTSIPDSSVNISKFSWVITGISIIQILSQQKGSLTYRMVNDFLCISNFRKPRQEKESLVAPSQKISPYIFVVNLLFLFRRVQAFWEVSAHHCLPHAPDPKGELFVSLPGQVSVAIPQSQRIWFFLANFGSQHATLLT